MSLRISHAQQQLISAGAAESNNDGAFFGGRSYDVSQVALLEQDDMRRIRNQVANINEEQQRKKHQQEDLQRLHNLSKERVSKWGNTIQGQRLAKLRARDLRNAKEEEQKLVLDAEEAERQAKERKEAIERARTMKYYQTDNVKGFHGAMLLTHVLNERDKQIEVKNRREQLKKEIEADWRTEKTTRQAHEEMKDILKKNAIRQKNMNTFAEQRAQAERKKQVRAETRELIRTEELEVVKEDKQYRENQKKLDAEARQLARENYLDMVEAHSKAKELRAVEDEKDLLIDESIRVYATAKENMIRLSKQKKEQLFKKSTTTKQKLSNHLESLSEGHKRKRPDPHHSSKYGVFDSILEDRTDLQRKDAINKETNSSHEGMVRAKTEAKQLECDEDIRILKLQIAENEADICQRKDEKDEKLRKGIVLQTFHKQQINERANLKTEMQQGQRKLEADVQKNAEDEEAEFQRYAQGVIRSFEEKEDQNKKNIQPLYNNLNEKHKKPGRRAPKDHDKPSITKQRLGLDSRSKPVHIHIPTKRGTYVPRPKRPPPY